MMPLTRSEARLNNLRFKGSNLTETLVVHLAQDLLQIIIHGQQEGALGVVSSDEVADCAKANLPNNDFVVWSVCQCHFVVAVLGVVTNENRHLVWVNPIPG